MQMHSRIREMDRLRTMGNRLTRRGHLSITAGLVGATVTAACSTPAAGTGKAALSDAPVTIQFYKRATIAEADLATMLQEWKTLHPAWNVEVVQNKSSFQ